MKKETKVIGDKRYFLLGINQDDEKVWLEEASWDCDWYWGLGYIEIFDKDYTDISCHTHFNNLFLKGNIPENWEKYFKESPLSKDEMWTILELMRSLYIAKEYSEMLYIGGANISESKNKDIIKNNNEYKRINEIVIPKLLKDIYSLLSQ